MRFRRFDPPALHVAIDVERQCRELSWDQLSAEIGVPLHVLERLRSYRRFTVQEVIPITQWLNHPILEFTRLGPPPEQLRATTPRN